MSQLTLIYVLSNIVKSLVHKLAIFDRPRVMIQSLKSIIYIGITIFCE